MTGARLSRGRLVAWTVSVFVILATATVLLSVRHVRSALPVLDGDVSIAGLAAPVEVWRDSMGVPHLFAGSAADLFFAQGYVHAQDRLWQMELLRRVATGRLSEIMGEALLPTDRFLRALGLWHAAGLNEERLDGETRAWLDAYAAGVNAWIDGRRGALPPEFLALRFTPEPWTPRHTLAVEQVMAWDLTSYQRAAWLASEAAELSSDRLKYLAPPYPSWGPTIVEGPAAAGAESAQTEPVEVTRLLVPGAVPPLPPAPAAALLDRFSVRRASNSWVVAGEHTVSGKPILANDMHLALRVPGIWYLMALHGGGFEVAGMTIPGAPFVVVGHNRALAWGFTNAYVDDLDLVEERVDPSDPGRYLTPWGSEPFRVIDESIPVRGRGEPEPYSVRWTRNGPLITEAEPRPDAALMALRWASHLPSDTWRAIPAMNRAGGPEAFLAAVVDFGNPHQNIVYADTAGRIGYVMGGRVPIRGDRRPPPLVPVPGWTGEWDWTGTLPLDEHPRLEDPPGGIIVTANNRQTRGPVADLISAYWEEPFRAARILELLEPGEPFDAGAMHRVQLDVADAHAARYRPAAVAAARDAGLEDAARLLDGWDGAARADSEAAGLYYVWLESLRAAAARDLHQDPAGGWLPNDVVRDVLERRAFPWSEDDGAAAFLAAAGRAMVEAAAEAGGRPWGELNRVVLAHDLAAAPWLDRLLRLSIGPAPRQGSPTTVDVSHYRTAEIPFTTVAGASQRHVVDLADLGNGAGFILPAGQSGIPFSRHYRDHFETWSEGGMWRVPLDRESASARAVHRLRLLPGAGG